ncbi:shikimate kinase [uncultured Campylobacter sp.]|uniref:shikimate kinase n=1 Tax=uncultured Campylobacter sp. TaxID=218934 RepID=UPI0025F6FF02|nr:shikimate kinase [uncultured Campylobacter sp.]
MTDLPLSCGSGFAKIKNLKQIGRVVYLKSSFEGIIKRLENSENSQKKFAKRPLLADLDKAKKLFEERKKLYKSRADLIVEVEGKTPEQIAKEIKTELKLRRRNR